MRDLETVGNRRQLKNKFYQNNKSA